MHSSDNFLRRLKDLNEIGIALSQQRDLNSLLETILVAAMRLTHADAGTLYMHEQEQRVLRFEILRNNTLNKAMGGTSGVPITFYRFSFMTLPGIPITPW
jgi:GAF domain-containing protein